MKFKNGNPFLLFSGFASAFGKTFLAENAAALLLTLSELLSHSAGGCSQSSPPRQLLLLKTGFHPFGS
jgi:hypothetical protein